ncbi:hypothetical protein [uncultured Deinococcus sp.]|uniref:hypothetical protein n=1 Tax=uncultured Deinococcus sp. TaxID=158789 RepID=UPI0025D07950|nr:hypothetical protein [uncultured Deinococcus sp.]
MVQLSDVTYRPLEASQSLVTLLQHEPTTFWATLARDLDAENLDASAAAAFPLVACVRMGLNWPSEHWQDHALKWVDALDLGNAVLPELERLVTEGRTQHLRHRARTLARRSQRVKDGAT